MSLELKPIHQQTIVITGATSGIGLATALRAAHEGARLVLAARSQSDLDELTRRIEAPADHVVTVAADVAIREDVKRIADTAVERFGGVDTWINVAGVSIWGRLEDVPEEESRRLFETNFWGVVNGSLEAARLLRGRGGAIINLGSLASDQAFPLQGMYCASKHAIKAFTDALRMELEETKAPISVTLVKPAGVDTPFAEHAANHLDREPALPPPVYEPEDVVKAILHAAMHPKRDVYVGSAAKMMSAQNRIAPRLSDWFAEHFLVDAQQKKKPAAPRRGTLDEPGSGLRVRGDNDRVAHPSVYTRLSLHPVLTAAALATVGLGVAGLVSRGALGDGSTRVARRFVSRAVRYAREAAHA